MKNLEDIISALEKVQELVRLSSRDLLSADVPGFVCKMIEDRLRIIQFDLKGVTDLADKMRKAGIRRDGFHYCRDDDCDSGTRWFVIFHRNRIDDDLVDAISNATSEAMYAYSPNSPYDCTGRTIANDIRIKRGRKVAVITQWRGLDV